MFSPTAIGHQRYTRRPAIPVTARGTSSSAPATSTGPIRMITTMCGLCARVMTVRCRNHEAFYLFGLLWQIGVHMKKVVIFCGWLTCGIDRFKTFKLNKYALLYEFSLQNYVPQDHLLCQIDYNPEVFTRLGDAQE